METGDANSKEYNKKDLSVPIIIDNKDIARIVFHKIDQVSFDIKISFMGLPFAVQTYNMFAWRPSVWIVSDSENCELTYHCERDGKDAIVHLKRINNEQGEKYTNLPLTNLESPKNDTIFPLPLFKIEVPDAVIEQAPIYSKSKYKNKLELSDMNVIEFYLSNEKYPFFDLMERFSKVMISMHLMSIDFLSSNSPLSDYQKADNFFTNDEERIAGQNLSMPEGIEFFTTFFKDERRTKHLDRIGVSFIENRFAQDVMLMAHIEAETDPLDPKMYSNIYCRGSHIEEISSRRKVDGFAYYPPRNTAAEFSIEHDGLSSEDKKLLLGMAEGAQENLYSFFRFFSEEMTKRRDELVKKAIAFLGMLERFRQVYPDLLEDSPDKSLFEDSEITKWVNKPLHEVQVDVYIMFAHYIQLYPLFIRVSHLRRIKHYTMVYDCMFDIDLFWNELEKHFSADKRTGNRVLVYRASDRQKNTPCYQNINVALKMNNYKLEVTGKPYDGVVRKETFRRIFNDKEGDVLGFIYSLMMGLERGEKCRIVSV